MVCLLVRLSVLSVLIALFGTVSAQEHISDSVPASEAPVIRKDCSLLSAKLVPEFSTQKNLKAPEQLPESAVLSEDDSVIIHLKASCDVARAAHASIAFTGSSPTRGKVVMMKAGSDNQSLKGKVKVSDLKPMGPELSVVFSVGDPSIKPMQWDAGKITIMHKSGQEPIAEPPVSKHDTMFTVPPSLSHTFRAPQEQPPAAVSLLATAVTVLPLLGLFYVLIVKLGANLSALTVGGASAAAFSVAFLGCIGAALCLGVVFWVKLKLVDLFLPLGGLAVFTVLVGHQALSRMADARMLSDKARKAE